MYCVAFNFECYDRLKINHIVNWFKFHHTHNLRNIHNNIYNNKYNNIYDSNNNNIYNSIYDSNAKNSKI